MLELIFEHQGNCKCSCDLTSEDFDLPIRGDEINVVLEINLIMIMKNYSSSFFGEFEIDIAHI
jgi:hypothetical protein